DGVQQRGVVLRELVLKGDLAAQDTRLGFGGALLDGGEPVSDRLLCRLGGGVCGGLVLLGALLPLAGLGLPVRRVPLCRGVRGGLGVAGRRGGGLLGCDVARGGRAGAGGGVGHGCCSRAGRSPVPCGWGWFLVLAAVSPLTGNPFAGRAAMVLELPLRVHVATSGTATEPFPALRRPVRLHRHLGRVLVPRRDSGTPTLAVGSEPDRLASVHGPLRGERLAEVARVGPRLPCPAARLRVGE